MKKKGEKNDRGKKGVIAAAVLRHGERGLQQDGKGIHLLIPHRKKRWV